MKGFSAHACLIENYWNLVNVTLNQLYKAIMLTSHSDKSSSFIKYVTLLITLVFDRFILSYIFTYSCTSVVLDS